VTIRNQISKIYSKRQHPQTHLLGFDKVHEFATNQTVECSTHGSHIYDKGCFLSMLSIANVEYQVPTHPAGLFDSLGMLWGCIVCCIVALQLLLPSSYTPCASCSPFVLTLDLEFPK